MKKLKKLKGIFSPKGASRTSCVILAGILSVPFTLFIVWITNKILGIYFDTSISQILEPRGSWTLITLIFSAPVALVVWHFRDVNTKEQIENHKQQVENQRKDINLKEFQKIAEWLSGIHISENNNKENYEDNIKQLNVNSMTYNKHDGAISLQIASIHSLLPFYRGDYGESFKKPALNLLKSAWHILHYNDLQELKECEDIEDARRLVHNINKRSHDAFGSSLMQVLLADGGKYLHQHPEVFSLICLSGINLYLPGLHDNIREILFCELKDASDVQLQAAFLERTTFAESNMKRANFQYSRLQGSYFSACKLQCAKFNYATVKNVKFIATELQQANFKRSNSLGVKFKDSDLNSANLFRADLSDSKFINSNLNYVNLQESILENSQFDDTSIVGANLIKAKGLTIDMLNSAKDIKGSIFLGSLYLESEWIEYLKSRGAILIMENRNTLLTSNNKDIILIAQNTNKETRFKYEISFFDIDLSATEKLNPDWKFEVKDKE